MSDGAKLTYLRGSLTGDALGVIASLSTTNAAVQNLKERFDQPFFAVRKLALDLLNINTSGWTTRELCDHMNRNIYPLEALEKHLLTAEDELLKADKKMRSDLSAFQLSIWDQADGRVAEFYYYHYQKGIPGNSTSATNSNTQRGGSPEGCRRAAMFLNASVADSCPICKGSHKTSLDIKEKGVASAEEGREKRGVVPHLPVTQQEGFLSKGRQKSEGGEPEPLRVNFVSFNDRRSMTDFDRSSIVKSDGTRLQAVQVIAHGNRGKRMIVNCLFDTAAERCDGRTWIERQDALNCGAWLWQLSPLAAEPQHPKKALTVETLCDNIVRSKISTRARQHLCDLGLPEEESDEEFPVTLSSVSTRTTAPAPQTSGVRWSSLRTWKERADLTKVLGAGGNWD
ncbi:hypothetical protein T4B_15130 [Trichinella pseudospiralis]|uniref:Uncharacterized protein n=1 Tax=Trichinella pseudospiralis TaxID=6337 RepID=A0A0V1ETX4_TRIPS|nr:hypothetical protein T4A_3305 [Trichinella pseudospiralis]KRZ34464.1 hypothetical protein T4B_15130 [Trichinella pseudospiralis]